MPAVGSSTKTISGRPTTAIASAEPLLLAAGEPPVRRPAAVAQPEPLDEHSASSGWACRRAMWRSISIGPHAAPGAAALQHHADAGEQVARGRVTGSSPSTRTVPRCGVR